MIQMGAFTGVEAMLEGPISKEKGSSYLVAGRYAVTGIFGAAATATELADVGYALSAEHIEPYG